MNGVDTFGVICINCAKLITVSINSMLDECDVYCPNCNNSFHIKFVLVIDGNPFLKKAEIQNDKSQSDKL